MNLDFRLASKVMVLKKGNRIPDLQILAKMELTPDLHNSYFE
jgi:hypothetical protein